MSDDIKRYVQRGCTDRETRDLLLKALDQGARMKPTRGGVRIMGPTGTAGAHFTGSDVRGHKNLRAMLRRAGISV